MEIGKRIKTLREQKGISQTELAEKSKSSKQTIYKYENGIITNIPSDKIELIAKVLDVTPSYLMGWEEEKKQIIYNSLENLPKDEKEVLSLYRELDIEDKAEIRGTMKGMLRAEKYSTNKSKLQA